MAISDLATTFYQAGFEFALAANSVLRETTRDVSGQMASSGAKSYNIPIEDEPIVIRDHSRSAVIADAMRTESVPTNQVLTLSKERDSPTRSTRSMNSKPSPA